MKRLLIGMAALGGSAIYLGVYKPTQDAREFFTAADSVAVAKGYAGADGVLSQEESNRFIQDFFARRNLQYARRGRLPVAVDSLGHVHGLQDLSDMLREKQ